LCVLVISSVIWALTGPDDERGVDPTDPGSISRTYDPDNLSGERDRDENRTPAGAGRRGNRTGRRDPPSMIIVRGRCVSEEGKLPLPGCQVDVGGMRRRLQTHSSKPLPITSTPTAYTGPDGRFEVELELQDGHHIRVTTKMNGRADMQGFLNRRRGVADAGDIPIPTGTRLVVRVEDQKGIPQPRIGFRFYRAVTGRRAAIAPLNWLNFESDIGGTFRSDELMASGIWTVRADANVKIIKPGVRLEIPTNTSIHETKFVVELPDPEAMITGRLVDQQGRAVPDVAVQAKDGSKWPIGYGSSGLKGEFQVRCRRKPGKPVHLTVPRAVGFETLLSPQTFPWGSTNVVLTLQRAGNLTVKVTADGGDRPVEEFRVVWFRVTDSGVGRSLGGREQMAHHPDGIATVKAVPAGKIRIIVNPQGKSFAPNEPYEFVKATGDSEIEISLAKRVELPVQVVDGDGNVIAGTRLQLVRSMNGKPVTLSSYAVDHVQYPQFSNSSSYVLLLDRTVTSRDGSAVLRWSASADSLAIRVLGPGHVPKIHAPVMIDSTILPIKIVVSNGTTLSGSVAPLSVLEQLMTKDDSRKFAPQSPTIILTYRNAGGPQGAHRTKTARVDGKGQFRILGLHPGKWDVTFRVWRFGTGRGLNVSHKKFDPVELRGNGGHRITLDISDMRPSMLRGQVFINGVPWTRDSIHLTRLARQEGGKFAQANDTILTTDDRGAFLAETIQPGTYRVSVDTEKGGLRAHRLVSSSIVDVPPGGTVDRVFHIESGKLRVRLVDEKKLPVPKQYLIVHHKPSGFRTGAVTGADGWMEIEPIGVGTYTIEMFPKIRRTPGRLQAPRRNQEIMLGEATVNAGSSPKEITLTIPDLAPNKGKRR